MINIIPPYLQCRDTKVTDAGHTSALLGFFGCEVNSVRMPGASCLLVTEVLKKMYFIATFEVVLKDIFWRHFVKHTHNCKHINKS